jgi:hypothetical protein
MHGGTISGNTASSFGQGGGVVVSGGAFTMHGGEISGNTASGSGSGSGFGLGSGSGGGVYSGGNFTMRGGTISGNSASSGGSGYGSGGGVYVSSGSFSKEDADDGDSGIIYGSLKADGTAEDAGLKNTASADSRGHAVFYSGKTRNATLGAGDDISTGDTTNWDP